MGKRKEIFKKLISKGTDKISKSPNIQKKSSKNETQEQEMREQMDNEVPEDFKKEIDENFTKDELIKELYFLRHKYLENKRELELTTFKLTQLQSNEDDSDELDIDLDALR